MGKNKNKLRNGNKASRTPEMIPSMFNWLTPDIQSTRSKELDEATKNK